jgi:hypothetical protein
LLENYILKNLDVVEGLGPKDAEGLGPKDTEGLGPKDTEGRVEKINVISNEYSFSRNRDSESVCKVGIH